MIFLIILQTVKYTFMFIHVYILDKFYLKKKIAEFAGAPFLVKCVLIFSNYFLFGFFLVFYRRELAKEVVELLTSAADGAKSLIDASDKLILYVEIARLFGMLGYQRKAAFFSRQVAQLYFRQENRLAAISAMQVLAMTTKAYHVQSRASFSNSNVSLQAWVNSFFKRSLYSIYTVKTE